MALCRLSTRYTEPENQFDAAARESYGTNGERAGWGRRKPYCRPSCNPDEGFLGRYRHRMLNILLFHRAGGGNPTNKSIIQGRIKRTSLLTTTAKESKNLLLRMKGTDTACESKQTIPLFVQKKESSDQHRCSPETCWSV